MKLIVGLGNPGRVYKYTRHNIGFLLIDRLHREWGIKVKKDIAVKSCLGKGSIDEEEVILASPLCFMNLAGHSVKLLLKKYNLQLKDILVVFDDLDLVWGKIRIRPSGSSGGHKGVESIIKALGSSDFARLRIGINRPVLGKKLTRNTRDREIMDYVLSNWTRRERAQLDINLEQAADCCKTWAVSGINKAMNKFNQNYISLSKENQ